MNGSEARAQPEQASWSSWTSPAERENDRLRWELKAYVENLTKSKGSSVEAEAKAEAEAKVKAKGRADAEAKAKADAEAKSRAKADADAKAEAEAKAKEAATKETPPSGQGAACAATLLQRSHSSLQCPAYPAHWQQFRKQRADAPVAASGLGCSAGRTPGQPALRPLHRSGSAPHARRSPSPAAQQQPSQSSWTRPWHGAAPRARVRERPAARPPGAGPGAGGAPPPAGARASSAPGRSRGAPRAGDGAAATRSCPVGYQSMLCERPGTAPAQGGRPRPAPLCERPSTAPYQEACGQQRAWARASGSSRPRSRGGPNGSAGPGSVHNFTRWAYSSPAAGSRSWASLPTPQPARAVQQYPAAQLAAAPGGPAAAPSRPGTREGNQLASAGAEQPGRPPKAAPQGSGRPAEAAPEGCPARRPCPAGARRPQQAGRGQMARTDRPDKPDHTLIESGLQEQRREWTVRVLEGVKDAEPSTKEDRAHSAHRRRVASQFAEVEDQRRDSEPDDFEVGKVPSITVHPDPEAPVLLDEGSPVSHFDSTALSSPMSRSPTSPSRTLRHQNSIDKFQAMFSDAETRRRRASRRESRRESVAAVVEFMDVDEQNTESLEAVFRMLIDDGEVHVDSLPHALDLMGAHPMKKWLDETLQDVTPHSTLNLEEFITFVQAYKRRLSQEIATAFREIDVDGSGCIDAAELTALLEKLGMTAMDVVIGEILEEVDMNQNGVVEQNEFEYLWILLEKREGFCKREYDRLLEAFCRFDTDHSGSIDKDEVMPILNYLNYSLLSKEMNRIFDEVNKSGNGELNVTEYMMFMRKVRESEINAMTASLPRVRFITKKLGLIRMLLSLGYLPDDDTLAECAQAVGISLDAEAPEGADDPFFVPPASPPASASQVSKVQARKSRLLKRSSIGGFDLYKDAPPVVSVKEAWRFLEFYRSREGMTNVELEYNKEMWNVQPGGETVDALGEKEIKTVDAEKAVMWLGWDAPYEVHQQFMYEVDVDRSGGISLVEFQKLIRMYRDREAADIISVCDKHELPVSDCLHPVLKEAAMPVLHALGVSDAKIEDLPTAQSQPPSQCLLPSARQRGTDSMAAFTDIYSIFGIVRKHRRDIRKTHRDHEGFGPDAMRDFQAIWYNATLAQSVNEGHKSVAQADDNVTFRLLKQLKSVIPESVFQDMELLEAVREIEINGLNSTFDFSAFVLMMRQAYDTRLRKRVEKEADAIADTGFSNSEVRDFRKIFIQYDPAGTDRLPFEDLKRILERILPSQSLKTIWRTCVKNQCEDMSADFPDFLRIMKECTDQNLIRRKESKQNCARMPSIARDLGSNAEAANESV